MVGLENGYEGCMKMRTRSGWIEWGVFYQIWWTHFINLSMSLTNQWVNMEKYLPEYSIKLTQGLQIWNNNHQMKQPSKRSRNHREWNMRDMKKIKYTGKNVVAKPESLLPCFSFLPSLLSSSSIHPVFCSPSPQPPLPVFLGKPLPVLLFLSSARMESLTISMACGMPMQLISRA